MLKNTRFLLLAALALAGVITANAAVEAAPRTLYEYFNGNLPSVSERAVTAASECGITSYRGTYEQNERFLSCLLEQKDSRTVDYWLERLRNQASNPLTEQEIAQVPEAVWEQITPQIIKIVEGEDVLGNIFDIPGERITETLVCVGSECDPFFGNEDVLGSVPVTRYRTTLRSSMTATQSTVPASSVTTFDGTVLTMGLLGNEVYLSIETGGNKEEIVRCTGLSGTTWTSCTRGLAFSGTSTDSVAANRQSHTAGSPVIMANVHYYYSDITNTDNTVRAGDGTTTGDKCFVAQSGQTPERKICYSTSNQKWYFSDDGVSTFNLSDGGSGLTASTTDGIFVTNSQIGINASTTRALGFDSNGFLQLVASSTQFLFNVDGELEIDQSYPFAFDSLVTFNNGFISNASSTNIGDFTVDGDVVVTGTTNFEGIVAIDGSVQEYTCGETISSGNALYASSTAMTVDLADDDLTATSTINFIGFALSGCTAGQTTSVQTSGIYTYPSGGLATSSVYYISDSGAISATAGTYEGVVGRAVSSQLINMDINKGWQFIEATSLSVSGNGDLRTGTASVNNLGRYFLIQASYTPGSNTGDIELYRTGRTSGSEASTGFGTGESGSSVSCSLSGGVITCTSAESSNDGNAALSGTVYSFY